MQASKPSAIQFFNQKNPVVYITGLPNPAFIKQFEKMGAAQLKSNSWHETHGVGERKSVWAISGSLGTVIHGLGTALIMLIFPIIASYMWHIMEFCDGSASVFLNNIHDGGLSYLAAAYPRPSLTGLYYLLAFGAIQALLQLAVPGKQYCGPITPKGNTPIYTANGVQCYFATLALFFAAWHFEYFNPAAVYDATGTIISTSNIFSLVFCGLLYTKGRLFPSSTDSGSTGSLLFDFYWGMELFPRLGRRFDIKTWTNCRMGMVGWAVLTLCYAAKNAALYGGRLDFVGLSGDLVSLPLPTPSMLVSVGLMQAYIFKFFLWETGYWSSMDIAHDRAGFYLCWGCLVWIPSIYTCPAMYLVRRPGVLTPAMALLVLALGLLSIYINYDADKQRHHFRKTHGKSTVWGKPPQKIRAKYLTGDGRAKESLLLASGWWGLARHFHYLPEICAALAWSCPGGANSIVPYFYVIFLSGLLLDRAYRDDERCRSKYGKYWEQYCDIVPYRIVPYVF